MEAEGSLPCTQAPPLVPMPSHMHPVYTIPPYTPKIHSNIIFPSTPRSSKWSLLFQVFQPKYCVHFSPLPYPSVNYLLQNKVHFGLPRPTRKCNRNACKEKRRNSVTEMKRTKIRNIITFSGVGQSVFTSSYHKITSRDNSVGIATRIRAGLSGWARNLFLRHRIQTGSGAHPAS
jgi:hypothetical protein